MGHWISSLYHRWVVEKWNITWCEVKASFINNRRTWHTSNSSSKRTRYPLCWVDRCHISVARRKQWLHRSCHSYAGNKGETPLPSHHWLQCNRVHSDRQYRWQCRSSMWETVREISGYGSPKIRDKSHSSFYRTSKGRKVTWVCGENPQRTYINSQAYLFAGWVPNKDEPTEGGHYFDVWTRTWSQMDGGTISK